MKKICQAKQCNAGIKERYVYCKYHWSLLPAKYQDELAESYQSGRWHRMLVKSRIIIENVEKKL